MFIWTFNVKLVCPNSPLLRRSSLWWEDASMLGAKEGSRSDWFAESVVLKVGSGLTNSFWFNPWVERSSLRTSFPPLFQVSDQWGDRVLGSQILGIGWETGGSAFLGGRGSCGWRSLCFWKSCCRRWKER